MRIVEDGKGPGKENFRRARGTFRELKPGFYESKDHVDKFTGGTIAPVIALQSNQHLRMSYGSIDWQNYLS